MRPSFIRTAHSQELGRENPHFECERKAHVKIRRRSYDDDGDGSQQEHANTRFLQLTVVVKSTARERGTIHSQQQQTKPNVVCVHLSSGNLSRSLAVCLF